MTDVPKIVHDRLRAATPEQHLLERTHPEADLLTAFAEQALSAAERDGVLQHLALCADCRDVVMLALPAAELTVTPVETEREAVKTPLPDKAHTDWFAWAHFRWAHLRWAALAASVAVAVLVGRPVLEHLAKPSPPPSSVASQLGEPAAPPASSAPVASGSTAEEMSTEKKEVKAKTGAASARSELSSHRMMAKTLAPQPSPKTFVAGNVRRDSATAAKQAAAPPPGALAFEAPRSANETVEVSAAAVDAATASPDANAMARNQAPAVEKAKPALDDKAVDKSQETPTMTVSTRARATSQARGAMFAPKPAAPQAEAAQQNASWAIAAGVLQRSLDGGQSWQTAVRADHALLCFAIRGQEVWAGGQAGTLLRSTDGGTTWSAVAVSFKGQTLSSDVTHIDVIPTDAKSPNAQGSTEIVLATADREAWNSSDGGKTWDKK